jgi:uncharacterized protein YgbK (DUF1537 family)
MTSETLDRSAALAALPDPWPVNLLPEIRSAVRAAPGKLVVLDDDPTGTQTVHGVPVWTEWSPGALSRAFLDPAPVFFILTNSRSLPSEAAEGLIREIARNLKAAADRTCSRFNLISRSDSTLRGHYPGEINWLLDELDVPCDGVILAPFFIEGGRYTIGDVHYVAEGDHLVPAAETEFARDPSFGYHHSNLRDWVVEKTAGRYARDQVAAIGLEALREGGPEAVLAVLLGLRDARPCVVNAAAYRDLEVLTSALLEAEVRGKRFIYRTAASFVRVRAGIAPVPLLTTEEILPPESSGTGGLVVAGSYVEKTTRQLAALQARGLAHGIEVAVHRLVDRAARRGEIQRAAALADSALAAGENAVIFTSREKVDPGGRDGFLTLGRIISDSLVAIVRGIGVTPAWLVAKGGITSSVIATDGLNIRRATVLGQALPGVPVWRMGPESRFPGRAYVIFPGNVGGEDALARVVGALSGDEPRRGD